MIEPPPYYDRSHIEFLEKLWGDGYLSPGGPDEVKRILGDVDLSKATVLDIGCGSGGITVSLVSDYGAQSMHGIDVEAEIMAALAQEITAEIDQEVHRYCEGETRRFSLR